MPSPLRLSVILPVYNAERTLLSSVESILKQTYQDLELIVVDDGSTDRSPAILDRIDDARVRVIHQDNRGISAALNAGLALAKGVFIARQDADDISLPDRLRVQVDFLDRNPDHAIVGTWSAVWKDGAPTGRYQKPPVSNSELQFALLFDAYFVHPTVMMRRSALDRPDAYSTDPAQNPPEDFDLWIRIARHWKVANIPEILFHYQDSADGISRTRAALITNNGIDLSVSNISAQLGGRFDRKDVSDLVCVLRKASARGSAFPKWRTLEEIMDALRDMLKARWPDDAGGVEIAHEAFLARLARNRRMWLPRWLMDRLRYAFPERAVGTNRQSRPSPALRASDMDDP